MKIQHDPGPEWPGKIKQLTMNYTVRADAAAGDRWKQNMNSLTVSLPRAKPTVA